MNQKKMYALISHYDTYFKQDDCRLLHSVVMEPHIDALLYAPNEAYPFWKPVNAGASEYKMSAPRGALGKRNEYMMFIDASEDMDGQETAVCLQVVLLNRAETDRLVEIDPELFSNFLYPDDGDRHFICERKRRDKF